MVKWFFLTLLVSISAAWVDLISLQIIDYTYACGWLRTNRLQHFLQCRKLMMRWMWYWLEFSDLFRIFRFVEYDQLHSLCSTCGSCQFRSGAFLVLPLNLFFLKYSEGVTVENILVDALFPCVLHHLLIICFKDAIFFTFKLLYLF